MCGMKITDHDHETGHDDHDDHNIHNFDEWHVSTNSIDHGITDAYGEMFFSPSGNSSKV